MSGAIHLLPLYVFAASTEATPPVPLLCNEIRPDVVQNTPTTAENVLFKTLFWKLMKVCTTQYYFGGNVCLFFAPRVRYNKLHTFAHTANNVKPCNAQQAAVGYLTMKKIDFLEELTVPQIKYSLHFLCNPKVRYSVHNSTTLVPILRQIHLILDSPSYFFEIQFNIILLSKPNPQIRQFPAGSLPNPVCISLFPHTRPILLAWPLE
jgi:hypothetical protein